MQKELLDNQIEGQMTIDDLFEPPERLFAVSKIFARARKNMTLAEQKTFVYALSQVKFKEKAKSNVVYLDKKVLANVLGAATDSGHITASVRRAIKDLPKNSFIEIDDDDRELYDSGTIITRVTMGKKNVVRIKFEDEYLSLFTGLDSDYLTMWSSDIFGMKNIRSVQFYELLRQETDTRKRINSIALGVKAIKEMFDIPKEGKGSYMREKGGFNRTEFEKKVIDTVCDDLQKTKMIQLVLLPGSGKPYEKIRNGKRIDGYRFFWTYTSHPGITSAAEPAHIQEGTDQEEPKTKSVAKGRKRKNSFNNFKQREYDFEELERQLLQAQERPTDGQ